MLSKDRWDKIHMVKEGQVAQVDLVDQVEAMAAKVDTLNRIEETLKS
jgi:hypothetical protein